MSGMFIVSKYEQVNVAHPAWELHRIYCMRRATRPNAKKEALTRLQLFIESISSLFADKFREVWIPVFAQTCYRIIQKAPIDKKANVMKQELDRLSVWIEDLRIRLLRDLARFVQNNQTDFNGNAKHWMERCCNEIWSAVVSEEAYLEWFAAASDNTDDLESWRAPLWLADALGISKKSLRLQEKPEQADVIVLSRHRTAALDDCDRLNAESTDKVVSYAFQFRELGRRLQRLSTKESQELDLLLVFLLQRAKLPLGLHDNAEETFVPLSHLASMPHLPKRGRRYRRAISAKKSEREQKIRRVIADGFKGAAYCQELDKEGVSIPSTWAENGCPEKYVPAYRAGKPWRHYINNEKWRIGKSRMK